MSQVRDMRAKWPAFRLKHRDKRRAAWEGELRPLHKTYTLRVGVSLAPPYGGLPNPMVLVVNPWLRGRSGKPADAIPHVYDNPGCPLLPLLCLHHPPTDRFDPHRHLVSNTVIPWTIDWLACYEAWLATGKWVGGGVSH